MDIINRLTEKIDNYENSEWGTSADVHAMLWPDVRNLRNLNPDNRANAMRDWVYKDTFECTEQAHFVMRFVQMRSEQKRGLIFERMAGGAKPAKI